MKMRKTYFLIVVLLIVVTLLIILSLFYINKNNRSKNFQTVSPTATPYLYNPSNTQNAPNINYKAGSLQEDFQRLENKKPLSDSDKTARENLLAKFGNISTTLFTNGLYQIDYVKEPDDFEVTILTIDIPTAKKGAIAWFINQGFSNDGICKLPVTFDILSEIRLDLPENVVFDPNPPNCQ